MDIAIIIIRAWLNWLSLMWVSVCREREDTFKWKMEI